MSKQSEAFPHPLYDKFVLQPAYQEATHYYYEPMMAANFAHAVMLYRCGLISLANAQALLAALRQAQAAGLRELVRQAGVEDLFFAIEAQLIVRAGSAYGGNLQLARSRNDLGYSLTRLALRALILQSFEHLVAFRQALRRFASAHTETLMPGYTHTQPAQPTSMAHYVAGLLAVLERDSARLRFAHETNNQSSLGAAALTGTGFPIDRELSARLLGFDSVQQSTYASVGASDNLTDVANALSSLGVNLSRFTHDMLFWATQESGAIRIDDSFIQISSIMPQKRNPVVLEHLRARISRMIAYASGIITQCHNIPFGDTQDIEDPIHPLLFGALETASEILQLYGAVIDKLQVNVAHLRERASAGFSTVTELADTLVRQCQLPFRDAHGIVSELVNVALAKNLEPQELTAGLLSEIAQREFDLQIELTDEELRQALDPRAFVEARSLPGGAAPAATAKVLTQQAQGIQSDANWLDAAKQKIADSQIMLEHEIDGILSAQQN